MSQGVERMVAYSEEEKRRMKILQGIFEERGGEGSVRDFLVMGATDPEDGQEKHWGHYGKGRKGALVRPTFYRANEHALFPFIETISCTSPIKNFPQLLVRFPEVSI